MHLCDAGKEALATSEWWHPGLSMELVLCSHHARRHVHALEAQGFETLWTEPLTALTPATARR
jgi:hypothetical protein